MLLAEEIRGRDDATRRTHRKIAGLPAGRAELIVVDDIGMLPAG